MYRSLMLIAAIASTVSGAKTTKAEGQVGNSGDFVLCQIMYERSRHLLDFYVGERMLNLTPTFGTANGLIYDTKAKNFSELADVLPIVEFWLNGLEALDPVRVELYRQYLTKFPNEWRLLEQTILPRIEDHGHVLLEDGCTIHQAATQQVPMTSLHGRYLVSARLWTFVKEPITRAGLILHEIIYREALALGHKDSVRVQVMTAMVADQKFLASLTRETYHDKLVELGFIIHD